MRRLISTGHGAWNDRSIGSAKTFDEARRVAEADHARRTEQTGAMENDEGENLHLLMKTDGLHVQAPGDQATRR